MHSSGHVSLGSWKYSNYEESSCLLRYTVSAVSKWLTISWSHKR